MKKNEADKYKLDETKKEMKKEIRKIFDVYSKNVH